MGKIEKIESSGQATLTLTVAKRPASKRAQIIMPTTSQSTKLLLVLLRPALP